MGESAPTETDTPGADTGDAADGPSDANTDRDPPDENAYRGLPGAIPYAFRASSSWLFRSYVLLGGALAAITAVLITLSLVVLIGATANTAGGTLTLVRAFYLVVGLAVVGPLLAPILLVARRHRLGRAVAPGYDRLLGLSGYLFVVGCYLGLVISIPPARQSSSGGVLAPLLEALYALPALWGLLPPVFAALVILLVHRSRG